MSDVKIEPIAPVESTPTGSSTTSEIHRLLTEGEHKAKVFEMALAADVHSLMSKVRDFYQSIYGRVKLDLIDWHWISTNVKNSAVAAGRSGPASPNQKKESGLLDTAGKPIGTLATNGPTPAETPFATSPDVPEEMGYQVPGSPHLDPNLTQAQEPVYAPIAGASPTEGTSNAPLEGVSGVDVTTMPGVKQVGAPVPQTNPDATLKIP